MIDPSLQSDLDVAVPWVLRQVDVASPSLDRRYSFQLSIFGRFGYLVIRWDSNGLGTCGIAGP